MKVTFIMPCVGKKSRGPYVKSWLMEPLAIAVLASLTPAEIERVFYDDRLESIPYNKPTDLAAINVETYTARRAYQIAAEYKKRGVPVVMGGFHATLMPEEILKHADAVVTGAAEPVWPRLLADLEAGNLQPRYDGADHSFAPVLPDRTIYAKKKYTRLTLIETGRGCCFNCEFCSIASFFSRRYIPRPVADVVREIKTLGARHIFFIDDNVAVDHARARELFTAIKPLGIEWVGQVSIDVARDRPLLQLMAESGCVGVLIGFESLNRENLAAMHKGVNRQEEDFAAALEVFREFRLGIYATFVFGYDHDTGDLFERTLQFALQQRFFFTAFNHLVPFPGTPLYDRLREEGRLIYPRWWLEPDYTFGQVAFRPRTMSPALLAEKCLEYRHKFYGPASLWRRGLDFRVNCKNWKQAALFWFQNLNSGREVARRQGLPLGLKE